MDIFWEPANKVGRGSICVGCRASIGRSDLRLTLDFGHTHRVFRCKVCGEKWVESRIETLKSLLHELKEHEERKSPIHRLLDRIRQCESRDAKTW